MKKKLIVKDAAPLCKIGDRVQMRSWWDLHVYTLQNI